MPYIKIWIHAVWTVKNREKILEKGVREEIFNHILQNAKEKGILIDVVNGHLDHVHCLFRLKNDQTIQKIMQLIKGESAFWINRNMNLNQKLKWQDEYFAVSVSESQVEKVRNYIKNQEEHHRKKSFDEEYDQFIRKYGFHTYEG